MQDARASSARYKLGGIDALGVQGKEAEERVSAWIDRFVDPQNGRLSCCQQAAIDTRNQLLALRDTIGGVAARADDHYVAVRATAGSIETLADRGAKLKAEGGKLLLGIRRAAENARSAAESAMQGAVTGSTGSAELAAEADVEHVRQFFEEAKIRDAGELECNRQEVARALTDLGAVEQVIGDAQSAVRTLMGEAQALKTDLDGLRDSVGDVRSHYVLVPPVVLEPRAVFARRRVNKLVDEVGKLKRRVPKKPGTDLVEAIREAADVFERNRKPPRASGSATYVSVLIICSDMRPDVKGTKTFYADRFSLPDKTRVRCFFVTKETTSGGHLSPEKERQERMRQMAEWRQMFEDAGADMKPGEQDFRKVEESRVEAPEFGGQSGANLCSEFIKECRRGGER